MKIHKTWLTVIFSQAEAYIEVSINYETGNYDLSHDSNDRNVTFRKESDKNFQQSIDRAECVTAALRFIKRELKIKEPKVAKRQRSVASKD